MSLSKAFFLVHSSALQFIMKQIKHKAGVFYSIGNILSENSDQPGADLYASRLEDGT